MKGYRVRRPKDFDEFLNLLKDKDVGVFDTLKAALVFSAAVGHKEGRRLPFASSGEPIAFSLFSEHQDQPFVYALALTEFDDVSYLREENFLETIKVFEEYAAGGLQYMNGLLDKTNLKESLEGLLTENRRSGLIDDLANQW